MASQSAMLEKLGARLDRHLFAQVLKFSIDHAESPADKADYEKALGQIVAVDASDKSTEAIAKARAKVGPLFTKFFVVENNDQFTPKYVDREFVEAADLNKAECKFRQSEIGDAKAETNIDALFLLSECLVRAHRYNEGAAVLKVYNTLVNNLISEWSAKRDDILRTITEKQQEGTSNTKAVEKLQREVDRIDKDISNIEQRQPHSLWGQYLCEVLSSKPNRQETRRLLDRIMSFTEDDETHHGAANAGRLWVLHWGLFHWFKSKPQHECGAFLELLFNQDRLDRKKQYYSNILQCIAPHLFRYVAVAAILNRKRRKTLRIVARMLEAEAHQHTEPVTQFVVELCVHSNFAAAAALLPKCVETIANDFFLHDLQNEFVTNARQLYFEDQLRIRKSLLIASAAKELGMKTEEAELWLVDLIREAKIDASIDSVGGTVKVKSVATMKSVWQHVMDQLSAATHHSVIA